MTKPAPTTLELLKALQEVSMYVGQLPTNAEKEAIHRVIEDMTFDVLNVRGVTYEEIKELFDGQGPIRTAARAARAEYFGRK